MSRDGAPSAADIHQDTLDLAKQLIACRSITPEDGAALKVIASRLEGAGFACERLDRGPVGNLWARHGDEGRLVCLAGHVDVVPPGPVERWTSDPFAPVERNGCLFGRGAADMKTSVAAMVTAAERFIASSRHHRDSLALLFTSDEEGAATDGTAAVVRELQTRNTQIDACLIGEPTSTARLGDTIKNGRRGSLDGMLTVKGIQCHIAYPERGRNPIHSAVPALAELAATEWDRGNEYFSPTSFQFSQVHAGTGAGNVIPGTLEARFNFRFSTESEPEQLKARVRGILDAHGLDYELTWVLFGAPFFSPRGGLVDVISTAIRSVTGLTPALSTSGGTSDGRYLAAVSREVVEFGPVGTSMHGIDEHVRLADLAPLSTIYEQMIAALLRADGVEVAP
jgi:succinyl-diaminopimelate desuccinylase